MCVFSLSLDLCVCVYVCVCSVCVSVCVCLCACLHVQVCACTHVYMCVQLVRLNYKQEGLLQRIGERSYVNEDEITVSPDHLPSNEQKVCVCVCCRVQVTHMIPTAWHE